MANLPEKELIRQAVNEFCEQQGLSKNQLVKRIGPDKISAATLSNIENGKWDSIDESKWRLIWDVVQPLDTEGFIIESSNYLTVFETCKTARNLRLMVGLIGDTGQGKTTALSHYSRRKNVYYVMYEKSERPRAFFVRVLQALSIDFDGNLSQVISRLADELNRQPNPLLIIDETQKMPQVLYEYLQLLRDKTARNCGIVLAGTTHFKKQLLKMVAKDKEGMPEFYSRINIWSSIAGPTIAEINTVLGLNGIIDKMEQKKFHKCRTFRELQNEILLYKQLNNHL